MSQHGVPCNSRISFKKGGENMIKKLFSVVSASALVLATAVPSVFATTITESGNGAFSSNNASVSTNTTTNVVQDNNAYVDNNVHTSTNTGDNTANFNTGGDTSINTGNATARVDLNTQVNKNIAAVSNCGTCNGNATDVTISGNGAYSTNNATVDQTSTTDLYQTNNATINNTVDVHTNSGKNDASFNTGGATSVNTGNAATGVSILNKANANVAMVGPLFGGSNGTSGLSAVISGNGAFSDNNIDLDVNHSNLVEQTNNADINNNVTAYTNSGKNDAGFNTGGDVAVRTGGAYTGVGIDNMANFNAADVSNCGCLTNLYAKIHGNGAFSDNSISADLNNDNNVFQTNYADLNNYVDAHSNTGKNDASYNTGITNDDVRLRTGNAGFETLVNNAANKNLYGSDIQLPNGLNVNLSFDLNSILHSLFLM